jgi:hypothetical protein
MPMRRTQTNWKDPDMTNSTTLAAIDGAVTSDARPALDGEGQLSCDMVHTVYLALLHPCDLNPHYAAFMGAALDEDTAFELHEKLILICASQGDRVSKPYQHDERGIYAWLEQYVERGLLFQHEMQALNAVMCEVTRTFFNFPIQWSEEHGWAWEENRQAFVRAAYALGRDMLAYARMTPATDAPDSADGQPQDR